MAGGLACSTINLPRNFSGCAALAIHAENTLIARIVRRCRINFIVALTLGGAGASACQGFETSEPAGERACPTQTHRPQYSTLTRNRPLAGAVGPDCSGSTVRSLT